MDGDFGDFDHMIGWQSEIAELYHVRGIPQNFLLDPKGVIIATNLRGEELLKTLEDILGK